MGSWKAVTIKNPWASLILARKKTVEVRTWATSHRGPLALHASQVPARLQLQDVFGADQLDPLVVDGDDVELVPEGHVFAVAELVAVVPLGGEAWDRTKASHRVSGNVVGDGQRRLQGWVLDNVRPVTPVLARGMPGLWTFHGELAVHA